MATDTLSNLALDLSLDLSSDVENDESCFSSSSSSSGSSCSTRSGSLVSEENSKMGEVELPGTPQEPRSPDVRIEKEQRAESPSTVCTESTADASFDASPASSPEASPVKAADGEEQAVSEYEFVEKEETSGLYLQKKQSNVICNQKEECDDEDHFIQTLFHETCFTLEHIITDYMISPFLLNVLDTYEKEHEDDQSFILQGKEDASQASSEGCSYDSGDWSDADSDFDSSTVVSKHLDDSHLPTIEEEEKSNLSMDTAFESLEEKKEIVTSLEIDLFISGVVRLQALIRGKLAKQNYILQLGCAIIIQSFYSKYLLRKKKSNPRTPPPKAGTLAETPDVSIEKKEQMPTPRSLEVIMDALKNETSIAPSEGPPRLHPTCAHQEIKPDAAPSVEEAPSEADAAVVKKQPRQSHHSQPKKGGDSSTQQVHVVVKNNSKPWIIARTRLSKTRASASGSPVKIEERRKDQPIFIANSSSLKTEKAVVAVAPTTRKSKHSKELFPEEPVPSEEAPASNPVLAARARLSKMSTGYKGVSSRVSGKQQEAKSEESSDSSLVVRASTLKKENPWVVARVGISKKSSEENNQVVVPTVVSAPEVPAEDSKEENTVDIAAAFTTAIPTKDNTKKYYSLKELQRKDKLSDVDYACREVHLSPEEFQKHFNMTLPNFQKLPKWKKDRAKKQVGLF